MRHWQPDVELDRLLEALGQDLLAATDEEVREVHRTTGHALSAAAREVRTLIASLDDRPDEVDARMPLPDAARRLAVFLRPQ